MIMCWHYYCPSLNPFLVCKNLFLLYPLGEKIKCNQIWNLPPQLMKYLRISWALLTWFMISVSCWLCVKVHKDDMDAHALACLEPQHMILCSKHHTIKYHLFCENTSACHFQLLKIKTSEQLGGLLAKGFLQVSFAY